MAEDLIVAQRVGILLRVKDRAVVVGPGVVAGDFGYCVTEQFASGEVFELQVVEPAADGIDCKCQDVLVR